TWCEKGRRSSFRPTCHTLRFVRRTQLESWSNAVVRPEKKSTLSFTAINAVHWSKTLISTAAILFNISARLCATSGTTTRVEHARNVERRYRSRSRSSHLIKSDE